MKILLDEGAIMPTRAHPTDAGLDLYSREDKYIYPSLWANGRDEPAPLGAEFDTGVHIELPPGYYGKIESKSGLNVKNGVVSCGGTIDEGYTGSIVVKLYNFGREPYHVLAGHKIAQLIIQPYIAPEIEVVDKLDDTPRGSNGFGSTGR